MANRAQPLERSETRTKILDSGIKLMRAQGYNATTVDHICSDAGVTKGAFFHYFKSKDDIAKAALTRFHEEKMRSYENAPFHQLADPLARVFGRLDYVQESIGGAGHVTKGCLIGVFAQELAFTNPEIRDVCQGFFSLVTDSFARDLADARTTHAAQADIDPHALATLYVSIVQGSLILAKIAGQNDVIHANIEQFRKYLRCVFGLTPQIKSTSGPGSTATVTSA